MSITKNQAYTKIAPMMAAAGINQAANRGLVTDFANRIYRSEDQDQTRLLTEFADELARRTCNEQYVDFGDGRGVVLHEMPGDMPSFDEVRDAVLTAAGI